MPRFLMSLFFFLVFPAFPIFLFYPYGNCKNSKTTSKTFVCLSFRHVYLFIYFCLISSFFTEQLVYRTKVKTKKGPKSDPTAPLRSTSTSTSKKGKNSSVSEARAKDKEKHRRTVVKEEGRYQEQSAGGDTRRGAVGTGGANDGRLREGDGADFVTPTLRKVIPWLDGRVVDVWVYKDACLYPRVMSRGCCSAGH